jgi:hypothetical protein
MYMVDRNFWGNRAKKSKRKKLGCRVGRCGWNGSGYYDARRIGYRLGQEMGHADGFLEVSERLARWADGLAELTSLHQGAALA